MNGLLRTALAKGWRFLGEADWLGRERADAWCSVLALCSASALALTLARSHGGLDFQGKPLGTDFISFWTAARFAAAGNSSSAYDMQAHQAAEWSALPGMLPEYYAFFYPPVFLLFILPLAWLPYLPALMVWLLAGFTAMVACLRRILPQRWAILPMIAFPGVLANAGHGQNGFLSASCFGGFMLLLERRPGLAGTCLGCLVFKPHLLLFAPVCLAAARQWRAIAGAAAAALGLAGLSWLVLGNGAWIGFLHQSAIARMALDRGLVDPAKMVSLFAALRVLSVGRGIAYGAQLALCIGVACALAWLAARKGRRHGRALGAILVSLTMLGSPFLLDYDLVCLSVPMAWVMAEAQRNGFLPWEKTGLLAAYALPMFSRVLASECGIPVAPAVLALLALLTARRTLVHVAQAPILQSK